MFKENELHIDLSDLDISESIKESGKKETRRYEITGNSYHLEILEQLLFYIDYLGVIGSSKMIKIYCDGDGPVRIKVRKEGGNITLIPPSELPIKIGYGFISNNEEDSRYFDLG